jgi:quercetin dioxygenase-like cupin family protein
VIVLQGDAVAEIDGIEHRLSRWDTTYVYAGVAHRFCNASDTVPMCILWIYASVDATRTIIETGITSRVDTEYGADRN